MDCGFFFFRFVLKWRIKFVAVKCTFISNECEKIMTWCLFIPLPPPPKCPTHTLPLSPIQGRMMEYPRRSRRRKGKEKDKALGLYIYIFHVGADFFHRTGRGGFKGGRLGEGRKLLNCRTRSFW